MSMIEFIPVERSLPDVNRPMYGYMRSQPMLVKLANGEITTAMLVNRTRNHPSNGIESDLLWFGYSFKHGEQSESDSLLAFGGENKVVEWFDLGNNIG